jgi:hypothetical protein
MTDLDLNTEDNSPDNNEIKREKKSLVSSFL